MSERARSGLSDQAVRKTAEQLVEGLWSEIRRSSKCFEYADPKGRGNRDLATRAYLTTFGVSDDDKLYAAQNMVRHLGNYDPTPNGIYVRWIAKRYAASDFRYFEDVSKALPLLTRYHALKSQLPVEMRSIDRFKTFHEFDTYMDQFAHVETESQRQVARRIEAEMIAKGDAVIWYNDDRVKIIIPRTKEASIHFGRHTKWCTASEGHYNYFDDYKSRGDLYIILFKKENRRWQFHFQDEQFMDEVDDDLDLAEIAKTDLWLLSMFRDKFMDQGLGVFFSDLTEAEKEALIEKDGYAIEQFGNPSEPLIWLSLAVTENRSLSCRKVRDHVGEDYVMAAVLESPKLLGVLDKVVLPPEAQLRLVNEWPDLLCKVSNIHIDALKVVAWIDCDHANRINPFIDVNFTKLHNTRIDNYLMLSFNRFREGINRFSYRFDGPYPDIDNFEPSPKLLRNLQHAELCRDQYETERQRELSFFPSFVSKVQGGKWFVDFDGVRGREISIAGMAGSGKSNYAGTSTSNFVADTEARVGLSEWVARCFELPVTTAIQTDR